MDELISRQAAIAAMTDECIIANMDSVHDSELHRCKRATHRIIASLPSVQPQRMRGEWLNSNGKALLGGSCSICGFVNTATNYCPNCGADMRIIDTEEMR